MRGCGLLQQRAEEAARVEDLIDIALTCLAPNWEGIDVVEMKILLTGKKCSRNPRSRPLTKSVVQEVRWMGDEDERDQIDGR